jgi:2-polyprenyl-6-methoxyphenol hydroxylase-like FAD-dependent oxidoreductase
MPRYAERTEVSSSRSRDEIERTLTRYGATAFAYGWETEGERPAATVMFQIGTPSGARRILFRLPMPDHRHRAFTHTPTGRLRSETAAADEYERATRQRWRALALVIKAKLEAVEANISTIEQEFLAHVMLPGGFTVGEVVGPQIEQAYVTGRLPALTAGPVED